MRPLSEVWSATSSTQRLMLMPADMMVANCEHIMAMTLGLMRPEPTSMVRKFDRSLTGVTLLTTRHVARAFSNASNSSKASTTPIIRWPENEVPSYLNTATVQPFEKRPVFLVT